MTDSRIVYWVGGLLLAFALALGENLILVAINVDYSLLSLVLLIADGFIADRIMRRWGYAPRHQRVNRENHEHQ